MSIGPGCSIVVLAVTIASAVCCRSGESVAPASRSASPSTANTAADSLPPLPDLSRLAPALRDRVNAQYTALRKALETNSESSARADAYGAMAKLLLAAEYVEAAEPFFGNASRLMPKDFRWLYYLGHVARLNYRTEDAIRRFQQALAIEPDSVPCLIWLADVHLAQGQPDAAQPYLDRAVSLQPNSAAALLRQGRAQLARGDLRQALAALERAYALKPNADAIGYQLGLAYQRTGDARKAERYLRKPADVAAVVPDDPLMDTLPELLKDAGAFYVFRGQQAMEARKWAEAASDLLRASELTPQDAAIRLNLGTALFLSGDTRAGRASVEAAIRLDPQIPKAHYVLGLILETERQDKAAIEQFSEAVRLDATYIEALASLADALRRTGSVQQSLARYQQVITLNPAASQARFGYGMGLVRLGRYRDAAVWFTEASRLHPDQPGFPHALARILAAAPDADVRNGRLALSMIEELAKKDRSAPVLETMAMALAEVGRFKEAERWQTEAIRVVRASRRARGEPWMRQNLTSYEREEPCRVPWPLDDPVHLPGLSQD